MRIQQLHQHPRSGRTEHGAEQVTRITVRDKQENPAAQERARPRGAEAHHPAEPRLLAAFRALARAAAENPKAYGAAHEDLHEQQRQHPGILRRIKERVVLVGKAGEERRKQRQAQDVFRKTGQQERALHDPQHEQRRQRIRRRKDEERDHRFPKRRRRGEHQHGKQVGRKRVERHDRAVHPDRAVNVRQQIAAHRNRGELDGDDQHLTEHHKQRAEHERRAAQQHAPEIERRPAHGHGMVKVEHLALVQIAELPGCKHRRKAEQRQHAGKEHDTALHFNIKAVVGIPV